MVPSKVVSVYANLHCVRTLEVDDYFKLVMRFENGISAQVEVGTFHLVQLPRWYACGDGGALVINDWDCKGKIIHTKDTVMNWEPVVVQTKAGRRERWRRAPRTRSRKSRCPTLRRLGRAITETFSIR
ncbi:MAG: hypothetical protein IKH51_01555, partial [Clostridia bacterium]|nr:hypothetical protein [Clostridia bacterium]